MSKSSDFSKLTDFSELEALSNRIKQDLVLDDRSSIFNREKILEAGSTVLMKGVVKATPVGRNGSNWYNYMFKGGPHSSAYFLAGRSHKQRTLKRGWFTPVGINPETSGSSGLDMVPSLVKRTVIKKNVHTLSQTFYNTAPYARAVEYGHAVRMPYFYGPSGTQKGHGPITGFVHGQFYTWKGIYNVQDAPAKAIQKESAKRLKMLVKKK